MCDIGECLFGGIQINIKIFRRWIMTEEKQVTYKHLKKGQKISGIKYMNTSSGFTAYVKEVNPAFVAVEMWNPGGREEKINSDAVFLIELTDEEIREKYNGKAKDVVQDIQKVMQRDEIGCHEMYNAWLSSNPWELAQACVRQKLSILGHCRDIIPKTAIFSGDKLDIGVCAEDENGERFWCHFRSESINALVRRYERYQEWRSKRVGNMDDILGGIPFESETER
jgi:hypothetical protein